MCAEGSNFERLNRKLKVVGGTCGAGPVQHEVDGAADVDMMSHVVFDEIERQIPQVSNVRDVAGLEIVNTDDAVATVEQRFGEMRADEPRGTRNDDSHETRLTTRAEKGRAPASAT